jgi:hypothetical protein
MNVKFFLNQFKKTLLLGALLACPLCVQAADVFFLESFENYNLGPLDGDLAAGNGGVNTYPNGGISNAPGVFFNPWWGAEPPNLIVVTNENGVTPHSGTRMVRGASTNSFAFSQDLYNIGFRVNNGAPYKGNVVLDWWFYDPAGSGTNAAQYQDSISLAYYPSLPTNADYTDPNFFGFNSTEQFALGAANEQSGAFNKTKYQAQVVGAGNAYDGPTPGNGWFNTGVTRSVGWHHARIAISAVLPTGTAFVFFYIDDLVTPTLSNNTVSGTGVNVIEMDASYGNVTAYYDDISLDLGSHAKLTMTKSRTNIVLSWPKGWNLQSSTSLVSSNFADVAGATSPYTNSLTGAPLYFRLRY